MFQSVLIICGLQYYYIDNTFVTSTEIPTVQVLIVCFCPGFTVQGFHFFPTFVQVELKFVCLRSFVYFFLLTIQYAVLMVLIL